MYDYNISQEEGIRGYVSALDNYWAIVERLHRYSKYTLEEKKNFQNAINLIDEWKGFLKDVYGLRCKGYKVYSVKIVALYRRKIEGARKDRPYLTQIIEDKVYNPAKTTPNDKESFVLGRMDKGRLVDNSLAYRHTRPLSKGEVECRVAYDRKCAHNGARRREYIV